MNDALPIAGWYPDPEHSGHDRWWDGTGWSDSRRPAVAVVPAAVVPAAVASGPRNTLALVGFILAVSGVVIPLAVNALAGGIVSAVALRRSKRLAAEGVQVTGHGFALAGALIGFIWGALSLVALAALIVFFVWIAAVRDNFQFPDSPVM